VRFIERARSYIELLTGHIHRENETYFPIVEKLLSERQKKELLDSFEALDKAHHHEHSSMLQALQSLERIFPE
jgi:hemerythrin-like domain-containing protein